MEYYQKSLSKNSDGMLGPPPQSRLDNSGHLEKIIEKCIDFQGDLNESYNLLEKLSEIRNREYESEKYLFSKSIKFKLEKVKLKENIKRYVENQHSEKLHRIKSILMGDTSPSRTLISPEDMQTSEAARFLSLNKRHFGKVLDLPELMYESPFKLKKRTTKINPVETVLNNMNSMLHPSVKKDYEFTKIEDKKVSNIVTNAQEHTPRNKFVQNELKKLWPRRSNEINKRKQKIIQKKLNKIVSDEREAQKRNRDFPMTTRINLHMHPLKLRYRVDDGYLSM